MWLIACGFAGPNPAAFHACKRTHPVLSIALPAAEATGAAAV